MRVELAHEADFDGFRRQARTLLQQGVPPEAVEWVVSGGTAPELFGAIDENLPEFSGAIDESPPELFGMADRIAPMPPDAPPSDATSPHVPATFLRLASAVALHADRRRHALLYRLLWRLQREPNLRHDTLDPDMALVRLLAQAVRRDMHKMTAFVRFREVDRSAAGLPTLHVAWFEPQHHIVEATAPFFMRRFANMPWAILTPERCVQWSGQANATLEFGPGGRKQDAPGPDAGERLWLTYYENIFNPARLKLKMMEKEMPRRYWHNLPEATLISTLAARAGERSARMVAAEPAPTARRLPPQAIVPRLLPQALAPRAAAVIPIAVAAQGPPGAAATAADRAQAWAQQRAAAATCRACPIGALATQTVWGDGPVGARLMLVGEQPGDQEDLRGAPFVGPSGQLLNRAMAQLGWDRTTVYVTNAVKHFKYEPRGKRRIHKSPAQHEADACLQWLEAEIALVQPQAIVALGATAARQLLGHAVAVTRERGRWLQRDDGLPVLITLHPSALLRTDMPDREAATTAWMADLRLASGFALAPPL